MITIKPEATVSLRSLYLYHLSWDGVYLITMLAVIGLVFEMRSAGGGILSLLAQWLGAVIACRANVIRQRK